MAQKRMIDKKISISEKVADLDMAGKLLYTWMIPHADDLGILQGKPRTIKGLVMPLEDITVEDIGNHLESMKKVGLIKELKHNGKKYYYIVDFEKNQTLKQDRQPQTILDFEHDKDPKSSWLKLKKLFLEISGIQLEDIGNHLETEEKGSKEKLGEDNILNTGDKRPEISFNGHGPLSDVIKKKIPTIPPPSITQEWQEKAFRYADKLHIKLVDESLKGRWLKVFKQAHEGRKASNLEQAYSYLADYDGNLTTEEKVNFFFSIYENGLGRKPMQL